MLTDQLRRVAELVRARNEVDFADPSRA